jgi:hypothetical protein
MAAAQDRPLSETHREIAKYVKLGVVPPSPQSLTSRDRNLAESDIPKNFKCVMGLHLALEAFRLPCCDKVICADCKELTSSSGFDIG